MRKLFIFFLIFINACAAPTREEQNPVSPEKMPSENAAGIDTIVFKSAAGTDKKESSALSYTYRFSLPVGSSYLYDIETTNSTVFKTPEQDMNTSTRINTIIQYNVEQADSGRYLLNIVYKKISIDIKTKGEDSEHYDSENVAGGERGKTRQNAGPA